MASLLEVGSEFSVVVDLAVKDPLNRIVFVSDRLATAGDVDDRKSSMREPDLRVDPQALAIGTSMRNRCGHPLENRTLDGSMAVRINHTGDAAHAVAFKPSEKHTPCAGGRSNIAVNAAASAGVSRSEPTMGRRFPREAEKRARSDASALACRSSVLPRENIEWGAPQMISRLG